MAEPRNIYLDMPIDRIRRDATAGVFLARQAWRIREPQQAARVLGAVVEPDRQARLVNAVRDFMQSNARRGNRGRKGTTKL